jgi:hypothetical protein
MCHQVETIVSSKYNYNQFHSIDIQFLWHGHLQFYFTIKMCMSYIYMAQSFATIFMIKI